MNRLITLNEDHVYQVDGAVKPSVHEILNSCGLADASKVNEWYLDRGRYAHLACDMLDADELDWDALDVRLKPYVESYRNWKQLLSVNVLAGEQKIYCGWGDYCGTLDRIVEIGGKRVLLDLKTGTDMWWVPLQLVAYKEGEGIKVDEIRSLRLTTTGQAVMSKAYPVSKALSKWKSCVEVYWLQKEKKI